MELGELQKLRVLRLKYNAFEALPPVLSRFRQLEILELADNKISCLDDEILAQLPSVKYNVPTTLHVLHRHFIVRPATLYNCCQGPSPKKHSQADQRACLGIRMQLTGKLPLAHTWRAAAGVAATLAMGFNTWHTFAVGGRHSGCGVQGAGPVRQSAGVAGPWPVPDAGAAAAAAGPQQAAEPAGKPGLLPCTAQGTGWQLLTVYCIHN